MPTAAAELGANWWARAKRSAAIGMARLSVKPWFQRVLLGAVLFVFAAIVLVVLLPLFVLGLLLAFVAGGMQTLARSLRRGLGRDGEGRKNVRVIRRE